MRWHHWGRLAAWLAAGIFVGLLVAAGGLYAASEYILRRQHEAPLEAVVLPTDPAALELGRRRATLVGCYHGCHGKHAEGDTWVDEPGVVRLSTPNLTQILPTYSDAELVRLLRYGVRRDGTAVLAMPTDMFYHLSPAEMGSLIAFLRKLPPRDGPPRLREFGWRGRWALVSGKEETAVDYVDRSAARLGAQPHTTPFERGRYIAMITCPECHGADLEGFPGDTPPLLIAKAYSFEEFTALMRKGIGKGGRDLGLMSKIGSIRTPTLTDEEVADLYAFLQSRDGAPAAAARGP